ncbi:MAG: tRNA (guanosine(46)-N7)-methyltransferase TrmB [Sulfurovaceae bacterium]|nr:tRNA (guanosine(46)-N7)-methyltransferase TrmB [Sulfurovaceae bacterium]
MPHIKVTPISKQELANRAEKHSELIEFIARSENYPETLIGINYQNEKFLLVYKYTNDEAMLKYEKITRPLKLTLLKEAIGLVANILELNILSSNIVDIRHKQPLFASKYFKRIEDFIDIKFEHKSIAIEVGFGSGRHILYQAKQNPQTLFIGIEIHTPSAGQLLKQIEIQGLSNIWVVNYDARLFLEMLPSNICKQIFVHFPVPWDKKPSRRVIGDEFTSEAMRVLDIDGTFELRTDSDLYYEYALHTFSKLPKLKMEIKKNYALPIISKYEARWQRQSKDIYDVTLLCDEKSNKKQEKYDFNCSDLRYNIDIDKQLPRTSQVHDDYFIHFERLYKMNMDTLLIKCAFGSFARPEHKYIIVNKNSCEYYPSLPIPSHANYKAHLAIKEFLNG